MPLVTAFHPRAAACACCTLLSWAVASTVWAQAPGLDDSEMAKPTPIAPPALPASPAPATSPAPVTSPAPAQPQAAPAATASGTTAASDATDDERPRDAGEMTSEEVAAYFAELQEWYRHRYDRPITIAFNMGYGWAMDRHAVTPYRLGVGGSIGYTFPFYDTYLGVRGMRFLGNDLDPSPGQERFSLQPGRFESTEIALEVGREVIYHRVRVRALFSGGAVIVEGPGVTDTAALMGLGCMLMIPMGALYTGVEARIQYAYGRDEVAAHMFGLHGSVGLRF